MAQGQIRIDKETYDSLVRLKEEKYSELGASEFYTRVVQLGLDALENEKSDVEAKEDAGASIDDEIDSKEEKDNTEKQFHPEPAWYQGDICRDVSMLRKRLRENRNDLKEFLAWYGDMHTEEEVREFCYILVGRRDP